MSAPIYVPSSGSDDAPAINAALISSGSVVLGAELYTILTPIVMPIRSTMRGQGRATTVRKMANIDMVDFQEQASLYDMVLDGNGSTYTGRGVVIRASQNYQRIVNVHINSNGYCVECEATDSGSHLEIQDCFISRWPALSSYSIKLPDTDTSGGNRTIRNVRSSGGGGVDIAGAHNTAIERCNMAYIRMNPSCIAVQLTNSRFGYIEFRGHLHWVAFNNAGLRCFVTADCFQSLFIWSPINEPLGRQDPAENVNIVT